MSWRGILRKAGIIGSGYSLEFLNQIRLRKNLFQKTTVSVINTAGAATLTAAQILGGLIFRDPSGANRSDTTPTAASLIAAIHNCKVGDSFEFTIANTTDASETITLISGTGTTRIGTMTIAQNNAKRFRAVITEVSTPAYTVYSLGTSVY